MNISLYITVAVILGIVFIAIDFTIIRNKGRSSKLAVEVNAATIRATGPGGFDYRIDLDMHAKGDAVIGGIDLTHGTAAIDPAKGVNSFTIDSLTDRPEQSQSDTDKDVFQQAEAWQERSFPVAGEKLAAGTQRQVTGAGSIQTVEFMGGHWDWPLEGWTLTLKSSVGDIILPLTFTVHASSPQDAFCQNYGPSTSLIWSC